MWIRMAILRFLQTLATIAVSAAIGAVIDAGAQLIQNGGNVKDINWRSVG